MKRSITFVASLLFIAFAATPGTEAQMVHHSGGPEGDLVILRELGAVVGPNEAGDGLEVLTLLSDAAGKSDVEIKRGDLLLMAAGKRIREVAELKELYEGAAVGETVKLGFRRGDERFLVSFDKEEQPEGEVRMVMMAAPGEGSGDMQPFMECGVVLTEAEGKVVVGLEMPTDRRPLNKDDVVTSINGQAVKSLAAFREIYDKLEVGDDLEIVYTRGGEEQRLTRAKIDASGMIRMRRQP